MANNSYFGVKLGEAIASGAGHISDALRRKYEMQRAEELREQEMAQQEQQQRLAMGLALAKEGIASPAMPMAQNWGPQGPQQPVIDFSEIAQRNQDRFRQAQEMSNLEREKIQAQIGSLRGAKPPTNFRWTETGEMEAIPGSPADIKIRATATKESDRVSRQKSQAENVIGTVDKALSKVGPTTAGFWSTVPSKFRGTEYQNLKGAISTIQANLGFDRLTQMRAESPTGGALGQVSDRELGLLTSAVQNLSQDLSPDQLKENLQAVKTHYSNWLSTLEQAGSTQPGQGVEQAPIALPADKAKRLMELRAKKAGK